MKISAPIVVVACVLVALSSQARASAIHVGPNVHVSSAHPNLTHDEVLFGADPSDPRHLIGCSIMDLPGKNTTVAYVSFDRGRSWRQTIATKNLPEGDPACIIGRNHTAYFASLGMITGRNGKQLATTEIYTSPDGGKTWRSPYILPALDREYLTADVDSPRYAGHVYLNATGGTSDIDNSDPYGFTNGIDIYHLPGRGGMPYSQPTQLIDVKNRYVLGMGNGVVLSDGTFVMLFGDLKDTNSGWTIYPDRANAWLKTVRSSDGGLLFSQASIVDEWHFCNVYTSSAVPMIAADHSHGPFRDRIYAAWGDDRSGRCEIYLSHSSDKGATWSPAVKVNDDYVLGDLRPGDDFMPLVAVNDKGVLGIAWYDRREFSDNLGYRVRFAASFDGGETFTPSVAVASDVSSLRRGPAMPLAAYGSDSATSSVGNAKRLTGNVSLDGFAFIGGHTSGFGADAGGAFHAFWVDDRTGRDQVWTSQIDVDGYAVRNGDDSLANEQDVTSKVALELSHALYDRRTQTVTVQARVTNASRAALHGPISMRAVSLRSDLGIPTARNADNGVGGAGAVWRFDPPAGSTLAPDASSKVRTLRFSLAHAQPIRPPGTWTDPPQFVRIDAVMLAPSRGGK